MVICMKKKKKIKIEENTSFDSSEIKKVVITTSVVLIVFACFYFLTVAIVNKDEKKDDTADSSSKTNEVEIQHKEILLGSSFSIKDDQYLVVYYDTTDDDLSNLTSTISTYRSSSKDVNLYTVDMNNGLNKGFAGETSNKEATKASELSISGPTIIKFTDNKISTYIEGMDKVIEYLES